MNNLINQHELNLLKIQFKMLESCFIYFRKEDEQEVVDFLLERGNSNFVFIENEARFFVRHGKINHFFWENGELIKKTEKCNKMCCVYYIQSSEDKLPHNSRIYTEHMRRNLGESLFLHDVTIYKGYIFMRFSPQIEICEKNIAILDLLYGVGDYFILFSLYIRKIKELQKKAGEIYLLYYEREDDNHKKTKEIGNLILGEFCEQVAFCNRSMYNWFIYTKVHLNYNIISLNEYVRQERKDITHIYQIVKEAFGYSNEYTPYYYSKYITNRIEQIIKITEKKYLDDLFYDLRRENIIGLQCYSGFFSEKNGEWVGEDEKNWGEKNAVNFAGLCEKKKIKLVVLTPNPYFKSCECSNVVQLKKISLAGYIYAISKLPILVGIDSSAGHIASFYNIPSITIWPRRLVLKMAFDIKVNWCFRVMRNNMSIIPDKDYGIQEIGAEYVISVLQKIMLNEFKKNCQVDFLNMLSSNVFDLKCREEECEER